MSVRGAIVSVVLCRYRTIFRLSVSISITWICFRLKLPEEDMDGKLNGAG